MNAMLGLILEILKLCSFSSFSNLLFILQGDLLVTLEFVKAMRFIYYMYIFKLNVKSVNFVSI